MEVKEFREKIHLTYREFAVAIGSTEQSVRNWEAAEKRVSDKGIHPLFRKEMERLAKRHKIEIGKDAADGQGEA